MASAGFAVDAFRVTGLCAAPFTPFVDELGPCPAVAFDSIAAHVEELLRQGVHYAFVCGTTGEGVTMTVAERQAVLERWIKEAAGRLSIIAHVGAEGIADVLTLTRHAQAAGAAAIAAMPTCFNKPPTLDSIVDLLAAISAAAPALPLYYYHISCKNGVNIRCCKLLERIHAVRAARLPSFRGIKFTDFDLHDLSSCITFAGGAYDVLSGRDEVLLGALAMGARGAVGSTYNYSGGDYNALIAAFKAGDMVEALRLQRATQACVDLLLTPDKYGGPGACV